MDSPIFDPYWFSHPTPVAVLNPNTGEPFSQPIWTVVCRACGAILWMNPENYELHSMTYRHQNFHMAAGVSPIY